MKITDDNFQRLYPKIATKLSVDHDYVVTAENFHNLCHNLARGVCELLRSKGLPMPPGLTQFEIGEGFKSVILEQLPRKYVAFVGSGMFKFTEDVPYNVMLKATIEAGISLE